LIYKLLFCGLGIPLNPVKQKQNVTRHTDDTQTAKLLNKSKYDFQYIHNSLFGLAEDADSLKPFFCQI